MMGKRRKKVTTRLPLSPSGTHSMADSCQMLLSEVFARNIKIIMNIKTV
jgi:hypothetical protein